MKDRKVSEPLHGLLDGMVISNVEISISSEPINVPSMMRYDPDPTWLYTDPSHHVHAFTRDGKLPTLHWRDIGDDETEAICKICEAKVEPRYIARRPTMTTVPGPIVMKMQCQVSASRGPTLVEKIDKDVSVLVTGGLFGIMRIVNIEETWSATTVFLEGDLWQMT